MHFPTWTLSNTDSSFLSICSIALTIMLVSYFLPLHIIGRLSYPSFRIKSSSNFMAATWIWSDPPTPMQGSAPEQCPAAGIAFYIAVKHIFVDSVSNCPNLDTILHRYFKVSSSLKHRRLYAYLTALIITCCSLVSWLFIPLQEATITVLPFLPK